MNKYFISALLAGASLCANAQSYAERAEAERQIDIWRQIDEAGMADARAKAAGKETRAETQARESRELVDKMECVKAAKTHKGIDECRNPPKPGEDWRGLKQFLLLMAVVCGLSIWKLIRI